MILYHGSYLEIPNPDLKHSRANVDFGLGFYTTPLYEQAEKWCNKFKRRNKNGFISCYSFDETTYNHLNVLRFDAYSEEWLDFILNCRSERDTTDYDIVIGPVADDTIARLLRLYIENFISEEQLLRELTFSKVTSQYFFHSEAAIKMLKRL